MIGIQLDGKETFLQTSPDLSISIRLENPILSDDDKLSPGSYSLPFELPGAEDSPSNATQLKNPDVIENNEAYQIQKGKLFFGGIPFKAGVMKAISSTPKKINTYFKFGLNSISEDFKTKNLRDVVAENIVISSSSITKKIYVKKNSDNWSITVNGKNFTGEFATDVANAINAASAAAVDTLVYVPRATLHPSGTTPSGLISAAFIEINLAIGVTDLILGILWTNSIDPLHELSVTVDEPANYQLESFDMDSYYDDFDTFMSDYPSDELVFPILFNANPYGEAVKITEFVNGVNAAGGSLMRNDPNWGINHGEPLVPTKSYNSLQPFILLKAVLDKIGEAFGFEWEGDFYEHPDFPSMIVDNNFALDDAQEFMGEKKFVFWRRSFNVSELVPDMKVPEFLTTLKSRYNLAIFYNDATGKVKICFREPLAKSILYDDITNLSSPITGNDDLRVTGFNIKVAKEEFDSFSVDESMVVGTPEVPIDIKCGRLHRDKTDLIEDGVVTGPYVSRKYGERFGFRIFYFKGIEDNGEFEYQRADINGTEINEVLNPLTGSGLYDDFWTYWLHFRRNRRSIKTKVTWPFRQLRSFDFSLKRRFNRVNYFVKSIEIKLTHRGVRVESVEMHKAS